MKTIKSIAALAISVGAIAVVAAPAGARDSEEPTFSDPTQIDNPYLPIGKFHRCVYRGEEDGERQVIKRTLLDRTRTFVVDGVPVDVAIVKDRVKADGKLVEDTRDFFAQDDKGAVRYFGELVDDIENGHVAGHGGSWLYGRDTNKIGVLMAPRPHVGRHWMSEDAPRSPSSTTASSTASASTRSKGARIATRSRCASTPCPTRRSSSRSTPRASA